MDAAASSKLFGLTGQRILVTGGSKGIGAAVVAQLASLGAHVFTCSRKEDELRAALDSWQAEGLGVKGCAADVSTQEGVTAFLAKAKEALGGVDAVLANVGNNIRKPSAADYTLAEYRHVMTTNLESAFLLCQAALPLLKESKSPSILLMSSVAGGPTTIKSGAVYAMTKAALDQLAKYLSCEWGKFQIRVNSVKPWYIVTPLTEQVLSNPAFLKEVEDATPLSRCGQQGEVAGLVSFLCSPAASYITGQLVAVDGGFSAAGFW